MKTIRKTTTLTLTRTTKKGGKVIRRYRKTMTLTRKIKKIVASDPLVETVSPSQNLDD